MTQRETADRERHGMVQSAVDAFLERTRAVADLMTSASSSALGALPDPVPASVATMLASMRHLVEQMPSVTAELDVLVQEVHAKRLSIQALQAELAALDTQLGVLEKALTPVEVWSKQWGRMRHALTDTLGGVQEPEGKPKR